MADEKKKRRGIGSINQFATLGNAKTPENQESQTTKRQDILEPNTSETKESETLDTQEPSIQDTKAIEPLNVIDPETQKSQESKRFIQVSEEELKRLMVEALQSQNVQTPKQQEKPKRLRQTVYLEPDLHKQVRHRIADTGEDISDVVNLALRQLLQ